MRSLPTGLLLTLLVIALPTLAPLRAEPPESADSAAAQLHALFDQEWEYTLRQNPTFASRLGDRRFNDRWPDVSLAAIERRHQHDQEVLTKLDAIDTAALSPADRLNYTLFRKNYAMDVEGFQYRWHLLPLNQRGGIQTANELADSLRFATLKDFEDWFARLRAFPAYVDQTIALMRAGIKAGMVHPKVIMQRVPAQIAAQIVDDPAASLFFKPFKNFPDTIAPADRDRLTSAAYEAIGTHILPAFRQFQTFFNDEYLPACTDRVGAWQLPRGKEMYAFRARRFTTTDLTPEEIHQIGQREVRRIRAQMESIIEKIDFHGTFAEFLHFLRTDPQFYYSDPQQLLAAYRALSKRLDPTLVKLFGRLPRIPYGVQPIPANIAPDTTTAYYRQPAADGSRAGTYFVNLYQPQTRPKYEMEALSIHEAVPGHHLQIALAMELGELPAFRRYRGYTAFTEGWGLYAESLGSELGFYQDPYSKFGQLTYEMWRAVRLVVDTGMHYMGWSRQQAIDFFQANAAKSELDIVNEIDRYIAWPGQALAYKIGELKIKELRARAEQELGDRFDIRAFHDVVLGSGALPLDLLEAKVTAWLTRTKKGKLYPVDEAEKDPSFKTFRDKLLEAAKKRDKEFLLSILDPKITNSFGGDGGVEEFERMWKLEQPGSELWFELELILLGGGAFLDKPERFCAPYVFIRSRAFGGMYDEPGYVPKVAVTGEDVKVRARPDSSAPTVDTLSYDIVEDRGWIPRGGRPRDKAWVRIVSPRGREGFIRARFARSPLDYRACFEKKAQGWVMTVLVAGD